MPSRCALFFILSLTLPLGAFCENPKPLSVYVSVTRIGGDDSWARKTCLTVFNAMKATKFDGINVVCDWNKGADFQPEKLYQARQSRHFDFYLEFIETEKEVCLRLVNWKPLDAADIRQASLTYKIDEFWQENLKQLFYNLNLQNKFKYEIRREVVKQKNGLSQLKGIDDDAQDGTMSDVDITELISHSEDLQSSVANSLKFLLIAGVATWRFEDLNELAALTQKNVFNGAPSDYILGTKYKFNEKLYLRMTFVQNQHRNPMSGHPDSNDVSHKIGANVSYAF